MPIYHPIDIEYDANPHGGSDVFARAKTTFSAGSLRKTTTAANKVRQDYFEQQLFRLSGYLNSSVIPVFLDWGSQRRMDKGCIGHSIARGFLEPVSDGDNGYVEYVRISRSNS